MKRTYFFVFILFWTLSCSQKTDSASPPVLSGIVQLGPVGNASVTVYQIQNGARGAVLGKTQTDSKGSFSIPVKRQSDPIEVVASGGSFVDEATGSTVSLQNSDELSAVVSDSFSSKSTPVTPLTQQARDRVFAQIDSGAISANQILEAHEAALSEVAETYGVDKSVVKAVPASPSAPGNGASDSSKAAVLLATLSQFLKDQNMGPDKGVNPVEILKELSKDFQSDGKLNGQDDGAELNSRAKRIASTWSTGMVRAASNLKKNSKASAFHQIDDATLGFGDFVTAPQNLMGSLKNTQVILCHLPTGNPLNQVTLTVSQASVSSHLAHGDSLGACTQWNSTSTTNAPTARYGHTAIWTGSKMIVWGGYSQFSPNYNSVGGIYDPKTDTWTATSAANAPTGRVGHTAIWTGDRMIIFGGWNGAWFSDGASFDPETNTWAPIADSGLGRAFHTAIFTGSKMIVWGGETTSNQEITNGAIYDVDTNTWSSLPSSNEPVARAYHTAVWTGGNMIVFGGYDTDSNRLNSGGVFNLDKNEWTATPLVNAPEPRANHTAVWTGGKMIVWGGSAPNIGHFTSGAIYDLRANTWTATTEADAPVARSNHTAVWTGDRMLVFGGSTTISGTTNYLSTGSSFDPSKNQWTALPTTNAPLTRSVHSAIWTGSQMIVFGGYRAGWTNTGGIFSP